VRSVAIALLLAAGWVSFASAQRSSAAAPSIAESRYFEPVRIPALADAARVAGGAEEAVAFQSLSDGALLVLGESAGERAPAGVAGAFTEVRLTDPLTGAVGYVYVASGEASESGALVRAEGRTVRGACYEVRFEEDDPAFFERLSVPEACGGTGRSVLAGFHVGAAATIRALGIDLHYDRSGVDSRVLSAEAGPLRVVRRLGYRVRLPFGGTSEETEQQAIFYPYHYRYPVEVDLPMGLGVLISRLEIEFATDWVDTVPMRFVHEGSAPARIDGAESGAEAVLDGAPFAGWRITSPAGSFVNLLDPAPDAPFDARLRYRDGFVSSEDNAPRRRVGFVLRSSRILSGDRWHALSTTIFPKPGDGRSPAAFAALLANPLRLQILGE